MDRLESRGLRVFATVSGTPLWATAGSEFSGVPENPADWRDFCYVLASRYHDRVDAWGFWNEPNLYHFWEGSRSQYLDEILLAGIEAVRTVDPDAFVAAPDLAHLVSADWDDWLDDIVSRTRDLLDVVTHHVYPSDGTSGDVREKLDEGGQFPWDPPSVRSVLDDAGWSQRPVWLTETGVQSGEFGEAGQEDFYLGVLEGWFGEDRDNTWLARVFFYEMVDPASNPANTWGILGPPPDLEPKLAYHAYASFIDTADIDDAEVAIHGVPATLGSRESQPIQIEVRNTGTSTWRAEDGYYLIFDVSEQGWTHSVDPVAVSVPVGPGETQTLDGVLISTSIRPDQPNRTVGVYARLVRIGGPRFGDAAFNTVTLTAHEPPEILAGPTAATAPFNGSTAFSVVVASDSEMSYRWRRHTIALEDNHRISGATGPEVTLHGLGYEDLGDYDCVITNAAGRLVTNPATLSIIGSPVRRSSGRVTFDPAATMIRWLEFRARGHRAGTGSSTRVPFATLTGPR